VLIDGRVVDLSLSEHGTNLEVVSLGTTQQISIVSERDRQGVATGAQATTTRHVITAQMPGRILHVRVQPGQQVQQGQGLLVMEAMKMENELFADSDLHVLSVAVRPGDAVEMGAELLVVES
jgi:biotin carboxyl carrier protein